MKLESAAALLCITSPASALPSPRGGTRFSLSQIPNQRFQGHDVTGSIILAHAKYGAGLPAHLKQAISSNPDLQTKYGALTRGRWGSAPATPAPMSDSEYVIPVQIGTPPQEIPLNLDTGSSDFWAVTTDTYPPNITGQKLYRPSDSLTSSRLPSQGWSIKYGDGAGAMGIVYRDRVRIGTTSTTQAVQSAVQVSLAISRDTFSSGIMGMASSAANTVRPTRQLTYMDNIRDQLERPLFTANLQRGRPGRYDFGFVDEDAYDGDLAYAAVHPNSSFWEVDLSGYQVGAGGEFRSRRWSGIVDTGTTLLLAPQDVVDGYYAGVRGSGWDARVAAVVVPCREELPDFIFGVGAYRGVVPGAYVRYAAVNETHCYGGIQTAHGVPFAVLGDVLLKAQFVVFDGGRRAVGFANKPTDGSIGS